MLWLFVGWVGKVHEYPDDENDEMTMMLWWLVGQGREGEGGEPGNATSSCKTQATNRNKTLLSVSRRNDALLSWWGCGCGGKLLGAARGLAQEEGGEEEAKKEERLAFSLGTPLTLCIYSPSYPLPSHIETGASSWLGSGGVSQRSRRAFKSSPPLSPSLPPFSLFFLFLRPRASSSS